MVLYICKNTRRDVVTVSEVQPWLAEFGIKENNSGNEVHKCASLLVFPSVSLLSIQHPLVWSLYLFWGSLWWHCIFLVRAEKNCMYGNEVHIKNVASRLFKIGLSLKQKLPNFQNNGIEFRATNLILYHLIMLWGLSCKYFPQWGWLKAW